MQNYGVMVRGVLLALILGALWNPRLPGQVPPLDLLVLIDASRSVDPAARDAAWRTVAVGARRMPAGSRAAIVRFGAQAVEELAWSDTGSDSVQALFAAPAPPQTRFLDDTRTDIAAAMEYALHLCEPGRVTRIALITDGRATTGGGGEALQMARRAEIPVYAVITPGVREHDSWIASLEAPNRIHVGQKLPVTITLVSQENVRGSLVTSLNGEPAARREVTLAAQQPVSVHMELPLPDSRTAVLSAQLQAEGDSEPRNNFARQIVNIEGVSPVLYLSRQVRSPTLARSLRAGGWDVQLATPAEFLQRAEDFHPGSIVLDDVAIADMTEQAWQVLTGRVTQQGTGLLVLGGPHAFGAGGYRYSRLEQILPVTAQARRPLPPAAMLFMLDTSGSMDRKDNGPSRLALARQAMLESARRLQPDDAVGLLQFAAKPHLILPPAVRRDPVTALREAAYEAPGGGTLIGPALRLAVSTLSGVGLRQKLLVLVTDGYVDKADYGDVAAQIGQAGIDVVALAVGRDADTAALATLTQINNGRLLRVDQIAQLPTLMSHELDQRRSVIASGRFIPAVEAALPFLSRTNAAWPALDAYAVTRERPSATVYLRAQSDPLFAAGYAGAGRVAVFTASLDDWHAFWSDWPQSSDFAGGVMDWIDSQHGADALHLSARQQGGDLLLTLETPLVAPDGERDSRILVRDPTGKTIQQNLLASAPGLYEARLASDIPGRYHAVIRLGEHQLEHDWFYGGNDEFMQHGTVAGGAPAWMRRGLLQPWPGAVASGTAADAASGTLRTPMLILVTLLYLLLLLWERRADLVRYVIHGVSGVVLAAVHRARAAGAGVHSLKSTLSGHG
jgi:Mg-chelatase subunit ChlD